MEGAVAFLSVAGTSFPAEDQLLLSPTQLRLPQPLAQPRAALQRQTGSVGNIRRGERRGGLSFPLPPNTLCRGIGWQEHPQPCIRKNRTVEKLLKEASVNANRVSTVTGYPGHLRRPRVRTAEYICPESSPQV